MITDNTGEPLSKLSMGRVKSKERHNCSGEILCVFRLGFIPAFGICLFAFGKSLGRSLGFEFGT